MVLAKDFFDLQFSFAEAVRDLSGKSLEAVLLEYTNLYVRFGFGRDFKPDHEGWQRYIAGLGSAANGRKWTYRFYLTEPEAKTGPRVVATFGCFSYARTDETFVRLHFRNTDPEEYSPLGRARAERRRAELSALFAHLKRNVSRDIPIVGASWLYNLRAYRRLFPPDYVSSARPVHGAFRSMPLWGQFLNRRGEIRKPMAESFLDALARTSKLGDLEGCFPFQALTATAPASEFYDFYGV
jgi:hypothetical protein